MPAIRDILQLLNHGGGRPSLPAFRTPLEMILFENVAYLAKDEARVEAFDDLRAKTGLSPERIKRLGAADRRRIAGKGIMPGMQSKKWDAIADLAIEHSAKGDLSEVLEMATPAAEKVLMRFPGIGRPSARWILLLLGRRPVFTIESNGLRVMQRLGLSRKEKDYKRSFASAEQAVADESLDVDELISLRTRLERLGKTLCRRSRPECAACALMDCCPSRTDRAAAEPAKKAAAKRAAAQKNTTKKHAGTKTAAHRKGARPL